MPDLRVRDVDRILQVRKHQTLRTEDLKKLRVAWSRTRAFVLTANHNPGLADLDKLDLQRRLQPRQRQLLLFEAATSARSGDV